MIPFIIALSFFMEAVDSTILNTAIPAMSNSLAVYPIDLKIALISYLLSLSIFIPISGWLADKYGIKKIFILALIIFTISSFFCGLAHNLPQLIIARFIQGFGGALGLPVGRLIILRTYGRENLIANMSRIIMVGALGLMLGPLLGGVITHYFSWPWIFWVNIPVGCFAIILSAIWLRNFPPQHVPPLDKIGFVLFGVGLAGLSLGLSALSETTMNSRVALFILVGAGALLFIYFLHSRHKPHPIVKTDLLKIRTFRISVTGNLLCRLGFGGIPFLIPLMLQIAFGWTPQLSGVLLAPTALGIVVVKPLILPLLRFFGFKKLLIVNTVLAGLAMWLFILVSATTPIFVIGLFTFFYGFVVSLQYTAMNSLAYADVSSQNLSSATSIMGTLQQFSQSFGVAVSALLIRFFSTTNLQLTTAVFHHTFFIMGLITLCSGFIFFRLDTSDGRNMFSKITTVS